MSVGKTEERYERRANFFTTDLPKVQSEIEYLTTLVKIERKNPKTTTIFYTPLEGQAQNEELMNRGVLRARAYLPPDVDDRNFLLETLIGDLLAQLELKWLNGHKVRLGATQPDLGTVVHPETKLTYKAQSVRVADRDHYGIHGDCEDQRLTLDKKRKYYLIEKDKGQESLANLRYLGDLGPRIELKSKIEEVVYEVYKDLNLASIFSHLPFSALELWLSDLLKQLIPEESYRGLPEVELKYNVQGGPNSRNNFSDFNQRVIQPVLSELCRSHLRLLLPFPHGISRVRRYHLCDTGDDSVQTTVVETMAGKLAPKIKSNTRQEAGVLIRDTQAEHSLATQGNQVPVNDFLSAQGWSLITSFEKQQDKVPFALPGGLAFLVSFDHCFSQDNRVLNQIELEFIGSLDGRVARLEEINRAITQLGKYLGSLCPTNIILELTQTSKFDFFSKKGD